MKTAIFTITTLAGLALAQFSSAQTNEVDQLKKVVALQQAEIQILKSQKLGVYEKFEIGATQYYGYKYLDRNRYKQDCIKNRLSENYIEVICSIVFNEEELKYDDGSSCEKGTIYWTLPKVEGYEYSHNSTIIGTITSSAERKTSTYKTIVNYPFMKASNLHNGPITKTGQMSFSRGASQDHSATSVNCSNTGKGREFEELNFRIVASLKKLDR